MSAEMVDTAEETIIDYITCPFCNDYIQPPSCCCENGHFICYSCRQEISKCPSCGSDKYPNKMNAVFDRILKDIYYPCNFQANGCSAYFKYDELKEHHQSCKFSSEPCAFHASGCPVLLKASDKADHEAKCEYGTCCRVYAKIKGIVYTECTWKGTKAQLPLHVTRSHQFAWSPHQIESNVALSWMLPMDFDFEKIELIHLKDVDEMFYFYSKSIANSRHFVAVQCIGRKDNWNEFMYSIEFTHENKKVGFEDSVIPYSVKRMIDCYVKVFKKDQKTMQVKRYLAYLDNKIREES